MRVYFVRHAESKLNALHIHQVPSVGLSELGLQQAERVARRCAALPIDVIVSSTYERAKQTAEYVSKALDKPIDFSPLLAEVRNPSALDGRHHDDPDVMSIKRLIRENFHRPGWRYADEETFFETKERAQRCLQHVIDLGLEHVLLVTHGGFMTMMVAVMLYGADLQPHDYLRLRLFVGARNTGITVCDYAAEEGWKLITWNDHAHLDCLEEEAIEAGSG